MNTALRLCATLLSASLLVSCSAVYPELTTPVRTPTPQQPLDPPPGDLFWISVKSGVAPEKTRDGRTWQELGGKLPDPYVVVLVEGKELFRTERQPDTLAPTWPSAPRGNFRIPRGSRVRVEMWHEALVKVPICVKNLGGDTEDWVANREAKVTCEGAEVVLSWEPAHPRYGYGFYYEIRTETVHISRVFAESPAARAGLKVGDQLVSVNGRPVKGMQAGELQGFFNAHSTEGVEIEIASGESARKVSLKEGAIFPLFSEVGSMP